MTTPSLGDAEFLLATCAACQRRVLTHVIDVDDDGGELRRCVHCDGSVGDDWCVVPAAELERFGYGLVEARGCGHGGGCGSGCGTRPRG